MTTFPRSPRILKGAFVQFDQHEAPGRVITFQYNPEKLYRGLEARTRGSLPRETITFTLILDAIDDLDKPGEHPHTVESGIYPQLSALELLLYPQNSDHRHKSFLGIRLSRRAKKQPFTLFIWGHKRVLPVRVTELHIIEEMFDPVLNPIRACIEITMQVLTDEDLPRGHKGYDYWKSHLTTKITMAQIAYANASLDNIGPF
jgi:hypothetical protein